MWGCEFKIKEITQVTIQFTSQKFWGIGLNNLNPSWSWLQFWHHLVAIFLADLNTDGDHFGSYGWLASFKTVEVIPGISQLVAPRSGAQSREVHLGEIWGHGDSVSTSSLDEAGLCLTGQNTRPAEAALLVQGGSYETGSWWIFQVQERINGQELV